MVVLPGGGLDLLYVQCSPVPHHKIPTKQPKTARVQTPLHCMEGPVSGAAKPRCRIVFWKKASACSLRDRATRKNRPR